MSVITLKIKYQDENTKTIRRAIFDSEGKDAYKRLLQLVQSNLSSKRQQFHVKFQDDEDEMCTIASTWELQEAVVLVQTLKRPNLKLFVTSKPALLEPVVVEMKKPAMEVDKPVKMERKKSPVFDKPVVEMKKPAMAVDKPFKMVRKKSPVFDKPVVQVDVKEPVVQNPPAVVQVDKPVVELKKTPDVEIKQCVVVEPGPPSKASSDEINLSKANAVGLALDFFLDEKLTQAIPALMERFLTKLPDVKDTKSAHELIDDVTAHNPAIAQHQVIRQLLPKARGCIAQKVMKLSKLNIEQLTPKIMAVLPKLLEVTPLVLVELQESMAKQQGRQHLAMLPVMMSRVMPLVAPLLFGIMHDCGQNAWARCGKSATKAWKTGRRGLGDLFKEAKARSAKSGHVTPRRPISKADFLAVMPAMMQDPEIFAAAMHQAAKHAARQAKQRRGCGGHRGDQWRRRGGQNRGKWRRFMRMVCEQQASDPEHNEVKVNELPSGPLSFGACGPHVVYLQRVLIQLGYMDQSAIRWRAGFYGPRTAEAISKVATAMRSENVEEVHGVFTNRVRDHLLQQLREAKAAPEDERNEPSVNTPVSAEAACESVPAVAPVSESAPVPVAAKLPPNAVKVIFSEEPAKQVRELVSGPVSEPVDLDDVDFVVVSEPVSASPGPVSVEPVSEPVSEPLSEPVSVEPVSVEPVSEPVSEPLSEPVEQDAPADLVNASPFDVQLQVLRAMGFNDRDRPAMLEVLQRTEGNLEATIDWLLNH